MMTSLIASAASGDTIRIASGTHSFSPGTPVEINKRITITGEGTCVGCGTGAPSWSGGATLNIGSAVAFRINVTSPGTDNVRLTGIRWAGSPVFSYHWYDYDPGSEFFIVYTTNVATFRFDNNYFDSSSAENCGFIGSPGVFDHNLFRSAQIEGHMCFVYDSRADGNGDAAWAEPTVYGGGVTNRWVFFENNTFTRPAGQVVFQSSVVDVYAGGRYVFRYNYARNSWILNHDKSGGGNSRSGVAFEVYNNTFNFESSVTFQCAMYLRDGSMLYYNNVHTGYWQAYVKFWNRRMTESQGNWGFCNGSQSWDSNIGPGGRRCADQVGTGKTNGVGRARTQPQALLPVRIWGNTGNATGGCDGTSQHSNKICNSDPTTIIDGVDYIFSDDGSAKPTGYAAYAYPHPLTATTGSGGNISLPPAPTNLTVQ